MKPKDECRVCFVLVIVAGLVAIIAGPAYDAMEPYCALEHVLTDDELKDEATRFRTIDILKRGQRTNWLPWLIAGVGITAIGSYGLRMANKIPDSP